MRRLLSCFLLLAVALVATGQEKLADPVAKGQRVYTCGHSFHVFMPGILKNLADLGGVKGHAQAGTSPIGGSRVIQHWDLAQGEDKFKAKAILTEGKVDVLTLSPIHLPDEGIANFVHLAVKNSPDVRVFIQENWLPFDLYDKTFKERPKEVDHNKPTAAELRKLHEPYFKDIEDHVRELNQKLGKRVVHVVPVGQAVVALREKILAGEAFGLKAQADLFTDAIGHAKAPLQALSGFCHYAAIYRKSPVGLPMPAVLAKENNPAYDDKLNRLLQEIAWDAVKQNPLAGVRLAERP